MVRYVHGTTLVCMIIIITRNPRTLCGHLDVLLECILNNVKQVRKCGRYT